MSQEMESKQTLIFTEYSIIGKYSRVDSPFDDVARTYLLTTFNFPSNLSIETSSGSAALVSFMFFFGPFGDQRATNLFLF